MSDKITKQDSRSILNFCASFDVSISDEDRAELEKMCKIEGEFDEETSKRLKILTIKWMINSQDEVMTDSMWDATKERAKELLKELEQEDE